ncbi:MAG: hypothetical protein HPY73_07440 [Methanomassiliicoccales archaeon]|nr:MAG: hypothetical protein HPY73_07440 [Methanomassiliicoccales archaeon]
MKRIGWFTTARGQGSMNLFRSILKKIEDKEIEVELAFMFINRDIKGNENRRQMVQMAKDRGIPVIILPSDGFMPELKANDIEAWREEYGKEMRKLISPHRMDFGVLAGYMLILDPKTCMEYVMINLHPALPGTYQGTWEEVIEKVVENKDRSYGATVHVCTPDLDRGDAIAYDSFDVERLRSLARDDDELRRMVRAEGVRREGHLLMSVIKHMVNGDLVIKGGKVYDREGKELERPPCLAKEIEAALADDRSVQAR